MRAEQPREKRWYRNGGPGRRTPWEEEEGREEEGKNLKAKFQAERKVGKETPKQLRKRANAPTLCSKPE